MVKSEISGLLTSYRDAACSDKEVVLTHALKPFPHQWHLFTELVNAIVANATPANILFTVLFVSRDVVNIYTG